VVGFCKGEKGGVFITVFTLIIFSDLEERGPCVTHFRPSKKRRRECGVCLSKNLWGP